MTGTGVRLANAADADVAARLLDEFNREFDTETPGPAVLADRLRTLLAGGGLVVLLADGDAGIAVVSLRVNVWYAGPVALLDELYVRPELRNRRIGQALLEAACAQAVARGAELLEINVDGVDHDARRFYERHGFSNTEPGAGEPMYFYYKDLAP
ncbi:GNAT family N-acetyltransferase [Hamadaea tsunoensis]|uniref:GNAT family N-acetyltransferase n=1 Tax=Hamadaea tsunoensis TaxID=53368 RepID=UPI00040B3D5F|nr:GNAT family N-acetyltransferase [Hamadaea tsunoensis]